MEENKELEKSKKKNKKEQEIELLKEKINALEEANLRSKAELINYRKRKDEEVSNLLKYAISDLLLSLLPVLDNFERAISLDDNNLSDEVSKFLSGFKMIYTSFKETLSANGVKEIDCLHQKFDSRLENCVFVDSDSNYENDVVLDVLLKGYTYNDKILRCASVKVNSIKEEKNNIEEIKEKEDDIYE